MTAPARQPVEMLPSFRQCLFDSFDAARRVMQEIVINEHGAPGAMQSLLDWADLHKLDVLDVTGESGTREVEVYLHNGSTITVIRAVPSKEQNQ